MRLLLKAVKAVYVIYAFIIFVVLMIPVFIWSLLVLPLGKLKAGNLIYRGCMVWADIWFFCIYIRHRNICNDTSLNDRSFIFVSNHISYLDAALIPKIFRKPLRPLGKSEMSMVPVFGFIYRNVIVSVDRSSIKKRSKSVAELKSILREGISVLVFPEGTFNTSHKPLADFYDGAFRVAIETGTAVKPVLILDSYSRMNYSGIFSLNPGKSRAVFLDTVEVGSYTTADIFELKNKVYLLMEQELMRYHAEWIG